MGSRFEAARVLAFLRLHRLTGDNLSLLSSSPHLVTEAYSMPLVSTTVVTRSLVLNMVPN